MSLDTAVLLALPANVFESSDGYQPSKASVEVLRHRLLWLQRLHSGGGGSATLRVCRGTLDVDAARRAACRAAEIRICWRAQDTRGGSAKSGSLLASLQPRGPKLLHDRQHVRCKAVGLRGQRAAAQGARFVEVARVPEPCPCGLLGPECEAGSLGYHRRSFSATAA